MLLQRRQRGQSVVEFGIIAILFTLIMFAIVDFGLLLNDWLSVSSAARLLARDAAVGMATCLPGPTCADPKLWNEAKAQPIPGVTGDPYFTNRYCCQVPSGVDHGAAVQLYVTFYNGCTPGVGGCQPLTATDAGTLDTRFASYDPTTGNWVLGTCATACAHPAAPSATGPGDTVVVTLKVAGAQVITPLVRPFFGGPACPDTSTPSRCYVGLSSSVAMRYEGDTLL